MLPFIDIHTHQTTHNKGVFKIQNIIFPSQDLIQTPCSIGIHPWYIPADDIFIKLEDLENTLSLPNVMAVGECGLDKLCMTDWKLQLEVFNEQVILANQVEKPLIIHCVKAYEEVLKVLSAHKNQVPVIFHGFNKHTQLAESLIKKGYFLSFGAALNSKKVLNTFNNCPVNQVFLETDQSEHSIDEIYRLAVADSQTDIEILKAYIIENFKRVISNIIINE